MSGKQIVLDANILLRGVLGSRVLSLLEAYEDGVTFYSADICFEEARKHIERIARSRGADPARGFILLERIAEMVLAVECGVYEAHEEQARLRIARDAADWPVVATALLLNCPVWTEDRDFFGSGVATWTTATIELYLRDA